MNRQENLIQILLKAEKPLTTQELAEQLNVSSRTIRSDLEKIESEILVHSMKLEKKPRVGIWIEGTQDEKIGPPFYKSVKVGFFQTKSMSSIFQFHTYPLAHLYRIK